MCRAAFAFQLTRIVPPCHVPTHRAAQWHKLQLENVFMSTVSRLMTPPKHANERGRGMDRLRAAETETVRKMGLLKSIKYGKFNALMLCGVINFKFACFNLLLRALKSKLYFTKNLLRP